jgi:hypothetical protein
MIFREHRGALADSIASRVELPDSLDALIDHMRKLAEPWPTMPPITRETVSVERWHDDIALVVLNDYGVFGYVSGWLISPPR